MSLNGLEIAVIGMSGRFPGAANINQFWENLKSGAASITFFTGQELESHGVPPEQFNNSNYVRAFSTLEDIEYFDSDFFDYTPREAGLLDPQVRVFHECVWNALEDSGYAPRSYDGLIGLYAGASNNFGWEALMNISGKNKKMGTFAAQQLMNRDFLCTRVAYKLDLKGPASFQQTACSTSLVAIHAACQGILNGECDIALAGGVTITVPQRLGYLYQDGMISSPDGHCRAFDERAKGVFAGNGVGVVVLKRLEDALNDRDFIYAVIKGSAINNDGFRKVGFTAPSIEGQADVIMTALEMAEVEPESISYVECHGTGTPLGDPVELKALDMAFDSQEKQFCALASVKTNVGHLDCAAGVAGFIKTVLSLHHKEIPASLHYESPNPKFNFEDSPFYVNTGLREWSSLDGPRRAGVSSFGIGGTNAHVILEEAPERQSLASTAEGSKNHLLLLSAKTQAALDVMSINLSSWLEKNSGESILEKAAYTLRIGREVFSYRRALVCYRIQEAVTRLADPAANAVPTRMAAGDHVPLVFMFSGQGAQYVNMGLGIYQTIPMFKKEMDRCFAIMEDLSGEDFKSVLYPVKPDSPDTINKTRYTQPLLFAFEYAMAKLLMSWGIQPEAMMGHSIGEYVAACLSGVLKLEDALRLVLRRGQLMQELPEGAMLSVQLNEERLFPLLKRCPEVSLAAVNSSSLSTVSGPAQAVDEFEKDIGKQENPVKSRRLRTSHAFHSAMMEPMLSAFEEELRSISFSAPQIPYISNVSGVWMTKEDALDPRYWLDHIRQTVRFNDGLEELFKEEPRLLVEVGPGQGLVTFVRKHSQKQNSHYVINLVRHPTDHTPDQRFLLNQVAQLWLHGVAPDWHAVNEGRKPGRLPLPGYPFEKRHYPFPENAFNGASNQMEPESGSARSNETNDPSTWLYLPSWQQINPVSQSGLGESGDWLIFSDDFGLGEAMAQSLKDLNKRIIMVSTGTAFEQTGEDHFIISQSEPGDFSRLFEAIPAFGQGEHRWNIAYLRAISFEALGIERALNTGYYGLVELARAMGALNIQSGVNLTVITNGVYSVTGDEDIHPEKATAPGLVKMLPAEYRFLRCRIIDIQFSEAGDKIQSRLIHSLIHDCLNFPASPSAATLIAYRGSRRLNRWRQFWRPVRIERSRRVPPVLKENGVYMITGGLGGIGITLARFLAEKLKAKLILTGRNVSAPEKLESVKQLEDFGAEVLIIQADAANEEQMKDALDSSKQRFGSINGIIHAAGIADGCINQQRSREISEAVMAPKIHGTLILDRLIDNDSLDLVAYCSSLASILTPVGQSAYSAANAFMDAFAQWRQLKAWQDGIKTRYLSIGWDTWRELGMAEAAAGDRLGDYGMTPTQGVEVFEHLLNLPAPLDNESMWAVSIRDLNHLMRARQPLSEKQSDARPGSGAVSTAQAANGQVRPRPELNIPFVAPRDERERQLAGLWAGFLGLEKVGVHDNFFELGATSLDIVHLNAQLEKILNRQLPVVTMFTYPTIDALNTFLKQEGDNTDFTPEEKERLETSGKGQRNKLIQRKRNVDKGIIDD